jgi:hypothetical protein
MKRIILLTAALGLAACSTPSTATVEQAGPNPEGVEPVPSAADPIGMESGGAAKVPSEITWTHFGEQFTLTDSIKVVDLLAEPAPHVDKELLVEGTVLDVCQKAGCWMVIAAGDKNIRVTVKEHGFAVAKDGAGQWARIQGTLKALEVDQKTVEHFEGESAKPEVMPEKQGQTYQLIATGVAFQDRVEG